MAKYGRGLNRELVAAVNSGELAEPLTSADVQDFVRRLGWIVSQGVVNVTLANAASETHSHTFRTYFEPLGGGRYRVRNEYRGLNWR